MYIITDDNNNIIEVVCTEQQAKDYVKEHNEENLFYSYFIM